MLLEMKNGTIWSLKPRPNKKVLHALNRTLKSPNIVVYFIVAAATIIILFAPLPWLMTIPIANQPPAALWACYFIAVLMGWLCGLILWITKHMKRAETLKNIVSGNVYGEEYIHEKHFAFQLIEPLIRRSTNDPELQMQISAFFIATRKARIDIEWHRWGAVVDPKIYRRVWNGQEDMIDHATRLTQSQQDADELQRAMRTFVEKTHKAAKENLLKHYAQLESQAANITAVLE